MAILKRHPSIETARSLGDDMLAEIILRLPVKAVARSRCVSKGWCATISDGYLRRRLPLQLSVVYFPGGRAPRFACADAASGGGLLEDRDLGFFPFLDGAVVGDACNGLLLFRTAGTARFYVVDPVTRRWAALPPPSRDARLSMLAFDPSPSGDPSPSPARRGYHVVNFTGRWRERGGEVEVFSSEAWAWAARDVEFGVPPGALSGSMHFHGGAVYALASDPDCVVRMDVDDPELACAVAELPAEPEDGDGRLAHSGGRLHYVARGGAQLKVWVLDDDDSSPAALRWRLKHAVKLDAVAEGGHGGDDDVRFLALHPEKDAAYIWSAWRLVEYDLTRKEVTGAWEFGEGEKNRVVKSWLVPSSLYLSDCPLADAHTAHVQC
ncbi:F-box protein At5g07610-like [Panicum virgatum]|uniref:F-box domain-containing protein n=1 Tax=Panicum virgatum TaxID=38727 RepID=A0A8T0RIF4_PANVG|nr:F-box protein At5g07610-like [Panicum virgatum]KAG2585204.1 hypothetical protein PVAP13_6KG378200 [Panicum virgatum]